MKTLIALVIVAAEALAVSACSVDAYRCRGPYGEPCGSHVPGASAGVLQPGNDGRSVGDVGLSAA